MFTGNHTKESYRYDSVNEIRAHYELAVPAGEKIGIKVQSLVGFFSEGFVNIKVMTPLGWRATVDLLVYWCVVTLPICLALANDAIYRFPEPPYEKPELRIGKGYAYAGTRVSGLCIPCRSN
jgi:hypothetical protein